MNSSYAIPKVIVVIGSEPIVGLGFAVWLPGEIWAWQKHSVHAMEFRLWAPESLELRICYLRSKRRWAVERDHHLTGGSLLPAFHRSKNTYA